MAVAGFAGFSINKNAHEDLEWIYYIWLTGMFMRTMYFQNSTNWEELKCLCLRIEKWTTNLNLDKQYLEDKIKEYRSQIDKIII